MGISVFAEDIGVEFQNGELDLKSEVEGQETPDEAVFKRLRSKNSEERVKTIHEIGDRVGGDWTEALRSVLRENDKNSLEYTAALSALLKRGATPLAENLREARSLAEPRSRMQIAYSARYSTEEALAQELVHWLKNDPDAFVREYAALSLGELGYQSYKPELEAMLASGNLGEFEKAAMERSVQKLGVLTAPLTPQGPEPAPPAPPKMEGEQQP